MTNVQRMYRQWGVRRWRLRAVHHGGVTATDEFGQEIKNPWVWFVGRPLETDPDEWLGIGVSLTVDQPTIDKMVDSFNDLEFNIFLAYTGNTWSVVNENPYQTAFSHRVVIQACTMKHLNLLMDMSLDQLRVARDNEIKEADALLDSLRKEPLD